MKEVVNRAVVLAQKKNSDYLFSNQKGRQYTSSGIQSNWQKLIRKAIGHQYHVLLLSLDREQLKNKDNLREISEKNNNLPIFIKCADEIHMWGKTADGWRLTELSSEFLDIKFPETKGKVEVLKYWKMKEQYYFEITCLGAHQDDSKILEERFTFHDIRRKTATDKTKVEGIEMARQLLGHTNQKMTSRYISGVQIVSPLK